MARPRTKSDPTEPRATWMITTGTPSNRTAGLYYSMTNARQAVIKFLDEQRTTVERFDSEAEQRLLDEITRVATLPLPDAIGMQAAEGLVELYYGVRAAWSIEFKGNWSPQQVRAFQVAEEQRKSGFTPTKGIKTPEAVRPKRGRPPGAKNKEKKDG